MVVQARKIIGKSGIAIPAVFRAIAVFHFPIVGRVPGGFQEIFQVVNRVSQKISIGRAHVDVKFALQFGAERGPVALQNSA